MSYFTGDDLIFYQDSNTGQIMSGGYTIDSILLKKGVAPMTTLNKIGGKKDDIDNDKDTENVSSIFENLAVPAGLFYYPEKNTNIEIIEYKQSSPLNEDIHDRLFKLVEMNNSYKKKHKTYKNKIINNNKKYSRKGI
jgi:hypothetical protein